MLCAGKFNLCQLLEITDCTGHMEEGGKKDAAFIARKMLPHVDAMTQKKPSVVDIFFFDGASNVQAAGNLLELSYPGATTLHGAEHVAALFFSDVAKIPEVAQIIDEYKGALALS